MMFGRWVVAVRVAMLAVGSFPAAAEGPRAGDEGRQAGAAQETELDQLLTELRSDPERRPEESLDQWLSRVLVARLAAADKVLAQPMLARELREEAIGWKLNALDALSRRDPTAYGQRWREFAGHVVAEYAGGNLARDAEYMTLTKQIGKDPADPTLVSEIERFAKTYPKSGGQSIQLFTRLAGLLFPRDRERALAVLDEAATKVPAELAEKLRQQRNALGMVGSTLEGTWSRLDGRPFRLAELQGKVVLMYSWATWCVPCVEKLPVLNEIRSKLEREGRGFEIVSVSYDDAAAGVIDFLRERDLPWIHVLHSEEFDRRYGDMGTPGSILVGRDGVVVARGLTGREEIEAAARKALGSEAPSTVK